MYQNAQSVVNSQASASPLTTGYLNQCPYSRANPSPRYLELMGYYETLHANYVLSTGKLGAMFPGKAFKKERYEIKKYFAKYAPKSVLDYGAGKGNHYIDLAEGFDIYRDFNIEQLTCYDAGYQPYSTLPTGKFDAVICTDVLEHLPEEDLPWILDEIFGFAPTCVYATVALYHASKRLPNGENAHTLVKPLSWWQDILKGVIDKYPQTYFFFKFEQDFGKANKIFEYKPHTN